MDLDSLLKTKLAELLEQELPKAVAAELDRRERTPRWLALVAAARRCHVDHRVISAAIRSGQLHATHHPAKNHRGEYHIQIADLEAWNTQRLAARGLPRLAHAS